MGYFQRPYILAHRGLHEYFPENSFEAMAAGADVNADGFEFDVRCSSNGTLMLHHDASLTRLMGIQNKIYHTPDVRIKQNMIKSPRNKSDYFSDEMADLKTVLYTFYQKYIMNIEVKSSGALTEICLEKLVRLLRELNVPQTIIVSSFHAGILKKIRKTEPRIRTGMLIDQGWDLQKIKLPSEVYSIHPHFSFFQKPEQADRIFSWGKPVFVWTVNHIPEYLKQYIHLLEAIITDDPVHIMEQLSSIKKDY
jgi:glycerophosphoryl diester phosphodiesterase